ncbi:MAG: BLUF domain-containing protein [Hymenobacter sp.]|nr:MAG: BLUF domain-containing protein [Hymenobacter sp.]
MHHIIYLSKAAHAFTDAELQDLLAQARLYNASQDITGMLLYGSDQFFQVMEGPEAAVQALYERVRQDPRHRDVATFADKAIAERAFPDWGMAFQPLDPTEFLEFAGYVAPAGLRLDHPNLSLTDQQLLQLLRSFVLPKGA